MVIEPSLPWWWRIHRPNAADELKPDVEASPAFLSAGRASAHRVIADNVWNVLELQLGELPPANSQPMSVVHQHPLVAVGRALGIPALQHEAAEAPVDRLQIGREADVS